MDPLAQAPNESGSFSSKRKGGTLKKNQLRKAQSDLSFQAAKANLVSVNDLFGKQTPGGFGSPVIDLGASFTSNGSTFSADEYNFRSDNPLYTPLDENGEPIEDDGKGYRTNGSSTVKKRWTLTFGIFSKKSDKF